MLGFFERWHYGKWRMILQLLIIFTIGNFSCVKISSSSGWVFKGSLQLESSSDASVQAADHLFEFSINRNAWTVKGCNISRIYSIRKKTPLLAFLWNTSTSVETASVAVWQFFLLGFSSLVIISKGCICKRIFHRNRDAQWLGFLVIRMSVVIKPTRGCHLKIFFHLVICDMKLRKIWVDLFPVTISFAFNFLSSFEMLIAAFFLIQNLPRTLLLS